MQNAGTLCAEQLTCGCGPRGSDFNQVNGTPKEEGGAEGAAKAPVLILASAR